MKEHNSINFSGGDDNSSYHFSVSNLNNTGVVPGSKLTRTSVLAKFNQKITDKLTLKSSGNYIFTKDIRFPTGDGIYDYLVDLENTAISYNIDNYEYEDGTQRFQTASGNNPNWLVKNKNNLYHEDTNRLIGNASLQYEITPWLNVKERIGIDTYNNDYKLYWNKGVVGRSEGRVNDRSQKHTEVNSDLTLNVNTDLTKNLSFTGLLGNTFDSRNNKTLGYNANGLGVPGFYDVSNATQLSGVYDLSKYRLVSVYGQIKLGFNEYAYLTVTGRNDWSSTLPKQKNSYFYPSISGSLIFTDLLNIDSSVLNFGKIRLSFARVGHDASPYEIHNNYVQASASTSARGFIAYPFNGVNGYLISNSLGNLSLKPEITTEYEGGINLRFLNSRAKVNLTYYNRTAENQIYTVSTAAETGYSGRLANAGSIINEGLELTLGGTPIETQNFSWDLALNYTRNRTKVKSLAEGVNSITIGGFTAPRIAVVPGENGYGVIQAQDYERNDKGQVLVDDEGYPVFKDHVGNVGRVSPDYTANLNTTFNYKNISLSALFDTKQGNEVLNFNYFRMALYGTAEVTEDRGSSFVYPGVNINTGEPNTVEIVKSQNYYVNHWQPVYGNYVEDGSFVKLRQVSLSYSLSNKLLNKTPIKDVTFTATGRNLWISTPFSMGDPEGNILGNSNAQGFYYQQVPTTRSFNFSVDITF